MGTRVPHWRAPPEPLRTQPVKDAPMREAHPEQQIIPGQPALWRRALWYRLPAQDWETQALPIGNGRLGAMLFGGPFVDRIQFNEQSLWGGLNGYDNALAGQPESGYDLSVTGFGSYLNFGDVVVSFGEEPILGSSEPEHLYLHSPSGHSAGIEFTADGDRETDWEATGNGEPVVWQAPRIVTRPLPRPQTDQRFKGKHVAGEARQVRLHKGRAAAQAAHAATAAYRCFKG